MATATAVKMTRAQAREIFDEAQRAGIAAAITTTPTPMVVGDAKAVIGPGSNEIDYSKPVFLAPQGICGRADIRIRPARGAFVAEMKVRQIGRPDSYYGGYTIGSWRFAPDTRYSQSYEIAVAVANAAAAVLSKYGIEAYVDSRLD